MGLLVAATALGVAGGFALDSREQPGDGAPDVEASTAPRDELAAIVEEIEALNAALDEERSLRAALELELAFLRQEISGDRAISEPSPAPGEKEAEEKKTDEKRKEWFDEAALRERGIDERRSRFLREQFEALQMEELYLRDQATREGWLNRSRFRAEKQQLRETARTELGAEDYDWLLYASGRKNRVLVHDVLENSPANAAGIRAGDLILRYDDVPVLTPNDLTTATTQGDPGSNVAVEIDRDGDVQRLYLSRGPLGARITAVRRAPPTTP